MRRTALAAAAAAGALAGCSPGRLAVRLGSPVLERGSAAFYEEQDPVLGREAMGSQLKLIEALLKTDPGNRAMLRLAAEGFGGYALMFLEDLEPERAKGFYLRSRDWGLRLMSRNRALAGAEGSPVADLEARLKSAGPDDVPGLFWAAFGWAGWIQLSKDDPAALAALPRASALMRRAAELSPGFYFGGPDVFFGAYYSVLPPMLGGDPARSKAHFEAALKASGGRFLMAKVLYAERYAVAVQDQDLFRRLLGEVLSSAESAPDCRLANEAAKLKARRLLDKVDDLF